MNEYRESHISKMTIQKDHYVAQTYLKHFANSDGKLYPYYKSSKPIVGKTKTPKQVCWLANGDYNKHLPDPRVLDKFLVPIENRWNQFVDELDGQKNFLENKYLISMYMAFLRVWTPTAKRLHIDTALLQLEEHKDLAIKQMLASEEHTPPNLRPLIEQLIKDDQIGIKITDKDYLYAIALKSLLSSAQCFFCAEWKIATNLTSKPYITSDNPICIPTNDSPAFYFPISPKTALTFLPSKAGLSLTEAELKNWSHTGDEFGIANREFVSRSNRRVIMNAENTILHSSKTDWLEKRVLELRNWRVQIEHSQRNGEEVVSQVLKEST